MANIYDTARFNYALQDVKECIKIFEKHLTAQFAYFIGISNSGLSKAPTKHRFPLTGAVAYL